MKIRKLWLIILVAGIVFIMIAGIAILNGINNIPSIDEQIPPGSTPIHIRITYPDNQTLWPLNVSIPIQISAWGAQPITTVEFYINDTLYQTQTFPVDQNLKEYSGGLNWQPGNKGQYILVARAMDAAGGSGISNVVLIESGEAIGSRSPIPITTGDTLESIAATTNISLEEIQQANPGLDPQLPLPGDSQVFLPNPPIVETNPNSIPAYDLSQNVSPVNNPPLEEPDNKPPQKWSFINDFLFGLKISNAGKNQPPAQENPLNVPPAPSLTADYGSCTVNLIVQTFTNSPDDEKVDGYLIYRSRDGGDFERIGLIPNDANTPGGGWYYSDPDQYGLVTYYAATFNAYGESAGKPLSVPLNEIDCAAPSPSGMDINDEGELVLPGGLDTAYLYIQINGSEAVRVPEGNRMFLPNSGQKFNLDIYLDSLVDTLQIPDLKIHMEVWGWQGGNLVFVGALDRTLHRTVLTVCSKEGEGACTAGGGGVWVREMNILSNDIKPLVDQFYELHWQSTSLSEAQKMCISMGETYNGPHMEDANPVLYYNCSYAKSHAKEGTFLLPLGMLLYPADKNQVIHYTGGNQEYYEYGDFDVKHALGTPFDLTMRSYVKLNNHALNDISNDIYLHYNTAAAPTQLPPLASDIPSLYDVEILEDTYIPPSFEVFQNWACVIVDSDPNDDYPDVLCPLNYVECGVNVECSDPGFWGTIAMMWDIIVNGFDDAKSAIAGVIAKTIPYCDGSQFCKDAIKKGVDYGVTAISGLPPNLPNSDELVSQGVIEVIGSGLGEIVDPEAIQYICGDACKTEIAAQLKPYLQAAKSYYSQPGCFNPTDHYGMFPVCVQPPAVVHPAPGSYDFPGFVMVRVTRKSSAESLAATYDIQGNNRLRLLVNGENANRMGTYGNSCRYEDNITQNLLPDPTDPTDLDNFDYGYLGDVPMQGPLYTTVEVNIPWLEPGQSVNIPIKLAQISVQNHGLYCIGTAHTQYLFFKGVSHMSAMEYCYSSGSSTPWVPCTNGGADFWDFDNPVAP